MNDFKLPEKWCIRANLPEAGKYFDEQSSNKCYSPVFTHGYLNRYNTENQDITIKGDLNAAFYSNFILADYTEITKEQFLKYVVNVNNINNISEPITDEDYSCLVKLLKEINV